MAIPALHEPDAPVAAEALLGCWKCEGDLRADPDNTGFTCVTCGARLVERDGILHADWNSQTELQSFTIDTFGQRWNKVYDKMGPLREFFLESIQPVQREFFAGKIIVDGGGGFGRLTKLMLDYGACHVVLLDASDAVFAAREYLAKYKGRVTLVRGNLLHPPLRKNAFDIFLCHGVMHHVGDPKRVMQMISRSVKPETGSAILWVYAREGNAFLHRSIELCRALCSGAGDWGRWRVAALLDAFFWLLTKCVYAPLSQIGLKSWLWYGEYFVDFLYRKDRSNRMDRLQMYHDFLTTPIADFYSRDQLDTWCRDVGFKAIELTFYRRQSWSVAASFDRNEDFSGN